MTRIVAESILDALEELKPNSVVDVELQEVYLGTVAPQILGVEVSGNEPFDAPPRTPLCQHMTGEIITRLEQ